jgi:hypothetical protein
MSVDGFTPTIPSNSSVTLPTPFLHPALRFRESSTRRVLL